MDSFRSESSSMLRLQRVVSLMRKDENYLIYHKYMKDRLFIGFR